MLTDEIDDDNLNDIPKLAQPFFNFYPYYSLDFLIDSLRKNRVFLRELFINQNSDVYDEMDRMIKVEIVAKFCNFAENLGTISLAFMSTFQDYKKEINQIFNHLLEYNVKDIINFYETIDDLKIKDIAKILGYPVLEFQKEDTKNLFEFSSINVKEMFQNIAAIYLELRQFYNSYKHGYRILLAKDESNSHMYPYFYKENKKIKQKVILIDEKLIEKIVKESKNCQSILKAIFNHHRFRVDNEMNQIHKETVKFDIFRKPSQELPTLNDPEFRITYRMNDVEKLDIKKQGKDLYLKFKDELEKNHYGKYVAFDIEKKNIITIESNRDELSNTIFSYSGTPNKKIIIKKIGAELDFEIF